MSDNPVGASEGWTRRRHAKVWALAVPIMLANVSIPLVGAVDTAVMGHLPSEVFIGAVAIGAVIFSFLYWGFGFLRMGTTGFVSQAYGAGDYNEVANAFTRAVLVGVAVGGLIGEYTAAIAGILLVRGTLRRLNGRVERRRLLDTGAFKALLNVNFNIFVRTICLVFAFSWFTAQGAVFGPVTLAANAILMQMIAFIAYGLDGFAHAVETLGGAAYGARNLRTFRVAVRTSTQWAAIMAFLNIAVFYLLGGVFVGWMTSLDTVYDAALQYLPWVAVSPLFSVWSFQLDGIYIGTTFTREMRNGTLLSLAGYLAAAWLLIPWWGNHGLWCALIVFFVLRALTLYAWYPRIEERMRAL